MRADISKRAICGKFLRLLTLPFVCASWAQSTEECWLLDMLSRCKYSEKLESVCRGELTQFKQRAMDYLLRLSTFRTVDTNGENFIQEANDRRRRNQLYMLRVMGKLPQCLACRHTVRSQLGNNRRSESDDIRAVFSQRTTAGTGPDVSNSGIK